MNRELKFQHLVLAPILGFLFYGATLCTAGESSTCLTVYKKGGAPAVFRSPRCPRWKLSNYAPTASRCQSAMLQGRRKSQEDRTLCALDIRIPFPGNGGLKEVLVGMLAVFDGHNGPQASEMASQLLLDYFLLHTYFLLDATYSAILKNSNGRLPDKDDRGVAFELMNLKRDQYLHDLNSGRFQFSFPENLGDSFHLEILKEALLRAIHDIDASFSKEASTNNLDSGSTATIMLIADDRVLVANVGDSKAFLCSEKYQSPAETKATLLRIYREKRISGIVSVKDRDDYKLTTSNGRVHLLVKELTRDHHPDQDDERLRIETAGGYVVELGSIPRVNGQLAISRAIGDVSFKRYGVISVPEVTDWQRLTDNDSYLVAASDGVFEKMSSQEVCDILWEVHTHDAVGSELSSSCLYSLADCIVETAFEKGSMDNMAVVIVPVHPTSILMKQWKEKLVAKENDVPSDLLQLEGAQERFGRLLVERKHDSSGCFYLYEHLNEHYTPGGQRDFALPDALDNCCGGPINFYIGQNICFPFGLAADGVNCQCMNPEGFTSFIGFLESIPFNDNGLDAMHDLRYVLKRRFGGGSYGEVWLAFHWDCQEVSNVTRRGDENKNFSSDGIHFDPYMGNSWTSSPTPNCGAGSNDKLYILKRIKVEKGILAYLSGLREKYFGEIFLNASTCLEGCGISDSFLDKSQWHFHDTLKVKASLHEIENIWNYDNIVVNKGRPGKALYEDGLDHIARYVESFESRSNEIWLVYHYEGTSLSKLIYTVEEAEDNSDEEKVEHSEHVQVLRPSKWWHWLKKTEAGQEAMRSIIWQLLLALKSCHDRNITHRDVKPENMVICFEDGSGRCLKEMPSKSKHVTAKMRIIDFGSAIDEFTLKHLYGARGPSRAEQTDEYTPPEAFLNASWYHEPTSMMKKYDMWSVGVVILELVLGSPNVFQISDLTRTLLDQHLKGWNEHLKEVAYKLRSFMEMCILIPGSSSKHFRHGNMMNQARASPVSWKCSEEFFSSQIKSRDPLKIGFPNVWAMRLVRQLLLWDPEDRLSIDDALVHPYFQPPPRG